MDDDDDIDISGIPDFAPQAQWAKGPPIVAKTMDAFVELYVPQITRQSVINQLYIEASDRTSRNQAARVRAWELIAELKGWKDSHVDEEEETTENLTPDEITAIAKEFNNTF